MKPPTFTIHRIAAAGGSVRYAAHCLGCSHWTQPRPRRTFAQAEARPHQRNHQLRSERRSTTHSLEARRHGRPAPQKTGAVG